MSNIMKTRLLIIEDDNALAKQMKWGLSDGYEVVLADHPEQARELLASGSFPVATLDLGLPPAPETTEEGFRLLEAAGKLAPHTKMIVITGNAAQENAQQAIALGAVDFCEKPIELELLKIILRRAARIYELEAANRRLQQECDAGYSFCGMLGCSSLMSDLFRRVRLASETEYPVLIWGETGTGKELTARAIHALSRHLHKALIIIDCSAIPDNLLESELFGHEKGAFTGATARKIGKLELAQNGTVFLDEIGDMPLSLQMKLLRFLQEGTIERVGGTQTIHLDVRVIAATYMDLDQAVREKHFRQDLLFRLNVVTLRIPPLRERREDILLLANHFLRVEQEKLQRPNLALSPAAAAVLTAYAWPGNIRELQNCLYRAIATSGRDIIHPADLGMPDAAEPPQPLPLSLKDARDEAEYRVITRAMAISGNNISQAAKLLDISRSGLHDLLHKHGLAGDAHSQEIAPDGGQHHEADSH